MNIAPVSVIDNEDNEKINQAPENNNPETDRHESELLSDGQTMNEEQASRELPQQPEASPMPETPAKKIAEKTQKETAEETTADPTPFLSEVPAEEDAEGWMLLSEEDAEADLLETQETTVANGQQVLFTPFFNDPGSLLTLSILFALLLAATAACLVLLRKLGIKSKGKKKGWKVKK